MKKFIPVLLIIVFFLSCKGDESDTSVPVISGTQPADNTVFTSGQTVNIRGTVSDNELHEGKITITNNTGGATLYTVTQSIHGFSTYNINESWVAAAATPTNATISIEVSDLSGNKGYKTIPIVINP